MGATGTDTASSTASALQVRPVAFSTGSITAPPTPHPRAQIVTIFGTDERSMLCRLRSDQSSCRKPARWPSRRTDKQQNWNTKTIPAVFTLLLLPTPPAAAAASPFVTLARPREHPKKAAACLPPTHAWRRRRRRPRGDGHSQVLDQICLMVGDRM